MDSYTVRRVHIGKTAHLDELAHECGQLYSQTLVFFWRTVRHKGIWLFPKHLKRLFTSKQLHAHTADACVEAFFAGLSSWRERRKMDRAARPPHKRKWYFRIEYKRSALSLKDGQLRKLKQQIADIEHQQTTRLVSTLYREGVQTVVIGDVRTIRQNTDVGSTNNQKLHQWSAGSVRHKLTYKAQRLGMLVALQEETHTSKTCPQCGHKRKTAPKGRVFRCANKKCGFTWHRDGVGAMNIRYKYRGEFGVPHVVAAMAPATGIRHMPHTRVARKQLRENVCVGNCTETAGL